MHESKASNSSVVASDCRDPENPALAIYDLVLQTLQKPEQYNSYYQLKPLLAEASNRLSIEVLREMYSFLLNFCIGRLNRGETVFLNELFELQKFNRVEEIRNAYNNKKNKSRVF